MSRCYCSDFYGFTAIQTVANIPGGYCNVPTGLAAVVTGSTVKLSWVAPHDYAAFYLYIRKVGDPWDQPIVVYGINYYADLDPLSDYEWQVETVCDLTEPVRKSAVVTGTPFSTLASIIQCTPINISTAQITYNADNSVTFNWSGSVFDLFEVELRKIVLFGSVEQGKVVFTGTGFGMAYTFFNIEPGASYNWSIRKTCNNLTTSIWSDPFSFVYPTVNCLDTPVLIGNIDKTDTSIAFLVSHPTALSFQVTVSGGLSASYTINSRSIYIPGLSANTAYTILVKPICNSVVGANGLSLSVTTNAAVCAPFSGLALDGSTETTALVDWVESADYKIEFNGNLITGTGNSYSFTGLNPGQNYTMVLYRVCGNQSSVGVPFSFTTVNGLPAPVITGSVSGTTMLVDWPDVATATRYKVMYKKSTDIAFTSVYVDFNTVSLIGLVDTIYNIKVKAVDINNNESVDSNTINLTIGSYEPCVTITDLVILEMFYLGAGYSIDVQASLSELVTYGNFVYKLYNSNDLNTVIAERVVNDVVAPVTFTALAISTNYRIVFEASGPKCTTASTNLDFTTPGSCAQPTNVAASIVGNDLVITGTLNSGAAESFTVNYKLKTDTVFITEQVSEIDFPLAIPAAEGVYDIELVKICPAGGSAESVSLVSACLPITNLIRAVIGSTVIVSWDNIPGVSEYEITVSRLGATPVTYRTDAYSYILKLDQATTYNIEVKAICNYVDSVPVYGAASSVIATTTLNQYYVNVIDAYTQDADLNNPGGDTEVNDGICRVIEADWNLDFQSIVDDISAPPNNKRITAEFSIPQNLAVDALELLPGGPLGRISLACRNSSSAILALTILAGGDLQTGSADLDNDGYIHLSGVYRSNGATTLQVRVTGLYKA